ncbi:MAG: CDP-glycerol glycerophosphotransferase family protein [Clostridia bacterium]|nr:CDP-glycerol glycerophosphotransferase family protein [Clostridia bacterium]
MKESLLAKLKRIRPCDVGHFFLFLLALLPAAIYRRKRKHLWLLCEYANEAQDNAFALFRHLRKKHPEIDAVYAIKRRSPAYETVAAIGPTVDFGSLKHWIFYLAAEVNISSQKGGKPNAAVCYVFEVVLGWLKNRRVFLQHGVTKDDLPFLHAENAKLSLFCCAAKPEYEFVRDTFGYAPGVVQYTGFCRFDALLDTAPDPKLVLILPTWRMWLERDCKTEEAFQKSAYFAGWSAFLKDPALDTLLRENDLHAVFCVHRNMSRFETCFSAASDRIAVKRWSEVSVPELIKKASVLVTDFSSVYMDFAFMKKPVVYYQFDREAFRDGHLPTGYFDYERDGFGPIAETETDAVGALRGVIENGCRMDACYEERVDRFFTLRDGDSAERTTQAIKEMIKRNGKNLEMV